MEATEEGTGQVTIVKFEDLARCVRCRRLVPPRRSLREGRCRCGGIKVAHPGMLTEEDIKVVEEEYGWDNVIIEGGMEGNYAEGLLQKRNRTEGYDGSGEAFGLDEARLHSRDVGARVRERDKQHRILVARRYFADLPRFIRNLLRKGETRLPL